jgi:hypothetical protein
MMRETFYKGKGISMERWSRIIGGWGILMRMRGRSIGLLRGTLRGLAVSIMRSVGTRLFRQRLNDSCLFGI